MFPSDHDADLARAAQDAPSSGDERPDSIPTIEDAPVPQSPSGRRPILLVSIAFVVLMAGTGLFLSGYTLGSRVASTPGTSGSEADLFAPFWEAYHAVTERYAGGDVDRKALVEGATKGLFSALGDPYSQYLTSDEYRDSLQGLSGKFEGIGAEIGTQDAAGEPSQCTTLGPDCRLMIVSPMSGSPAEMAGLQPNDVVNAIDGTGLDGLTVNAARDKVRGPKGTKVVLTIARQGRDPFDLTITRDVIESKEVETKDLAGGTVAYIAVAGFSDPSADAVHEAVKAARDRGITRFVLDLRGDPGGYVTAAQRIASEFIDSGPIFWQQDASGDQVATDATGEGLATGDDIHLAVLVDKGSASASEIVAAALKETGRGTLVGSTTYGKGTVQVWTELSNDAGGYRLTIARWLTPQKNWIHGTGVEPDIVVDAPPDTPAGSDPVLDRALLYLAGEAAVRLAPAA